MVHYMLRKQSRSLCRRRVNINNLVTKAISDRGRGIKSIGGVEDGVVGMGECADLMECSKMIAVLGVTMLAAGIGNIHGKYPSNWQTDSLSEENLQFN